MGSITDYRTEHQPAALNEHASGNSRFPKSGGDSIAMRKHRDDAAALLSEQSVSGLGDVSGSPLDIYRETRLEPVSPDVNTLEKTTPEHNYTDAEKRAWRIRQLKLTGMRTRAALDIACRYVDEVEEEDEHASRLSVFSSFLKCHRKKNQPLDLLAVGDGLAVSGVWRCRSKWLCPECAQRGLWAETQRLKGLLLAIQRENVERAVTGEPPVIALLVTLTAPHSAGEPLRQQMSAFSAAYGKTLHSTGIRKKRTALGFVGSVRCYDHTVTIDETGARDWHTHLHNLLIFETDELEPGSPGLEEFAGALFDEWRNQVAKAYGDGRQAVKQAFSVEYVNLDETEQHSAGAVADYAAKLAVLPGYMTKGTKGAPLDAERRRSLAPYDLLDIYNMTAAEDVAAAWVEYASGTKGFHRIDFSSGLTARFGLQNDDETPSARYVLPPDVAAIALASPLLMSDLKAGILAGDIGAVETWLLSNELGADCARGICFPRDYEPPITRKELERARDAARRTRKERTEDV